MCLIRTLKKWLPGRLSLKSFVIGRKHTKHKEAKLPLKATPKEGSAAKKAPVVVQKKSAVQNRKDKRNQK